MTNIAPLQGQGLHFWLLTESRNLLFKGNSPEIAFEILLQATKDSHRTSQDVETEIQNAIDGAVEYLKDHPNFQPSTGYKWKPPRNPLAILPKGNRIDRRKARMPVNEGLRRNILLRENPRIKLGDGVDDFDYSLLFANVNFDIAACKEVGKEYAVKSLRDWNYQTNFPRLGFVVPSYFWKANCSRSDLNVGERLYVVVEFDSGSPNDQFLYHYYLQRTNPAFPLVMLVWSGHKSIHGWYATYGCSERKVRTFQRKASEVGADQTCASPSAWIRMPNGWNYKHNARQEVLYFDLDLVMWQRELVRKEVL